MTYDLETIIKAFTLINALKYNGKANSKAVLGQIFGKYSDYVKNKANIIKLVYQIVESVNNLPLDTIKLEVKKLPDEFTESKKEEEKKELPPLPNVGKSVVMRLAPFPSGPLHIGNSRMVILNDTYVKRYNGKLLLVFDDTIGSEEKNIIPEAYDMILESLEYLDVKVHQIIYKSDRIDGTYEYCKEAIERGFAYICTCPAGEWRERYKMKELACPHRNQPIETNLDEWEKMLNGSYDEGEAVTRLKIGMDHKDPALKDPVMMRISKRTHPRVGTKYIVWPLLEFSWAIDDHLLGITHILRGKDLIKEDNIEKWVWKQFGWPPIEILHYGLITFKGLKLSKTESRRNIEAKVYKGWDDPRTWSIQSLIKRGIEPEALRETILSLGLSMVDIEFDPQNLYSKNKEIIDPKASRFFFVPNPLKLTISNITESSLDSHPLIHPSYPERGKRDISVSINDRIAKVYITKSDLNLLETDSIIRLKDLCNVRIQEINALLDSVFPKRKVNRKVSKKIRKYPFKNCAKVEISMPDNTTYKYFTFISYLRNLKNNSIRLFEDYPDNIQITTIKILIESEFDSKTMKQKGMKKIQWVPSKDNIKIKVLKPNGKIIEGLGEPTFQNVELNQIVHLERYGLGRINQIKPEILIYFAHK